MMASESRLTMLIGTSMHSKDLRSVCTIQGTLVKMSLWSLDRFYGIKDIRNIRMASTVRPQYPARMVSQLSSPCYTTFKVFCTHFNLDVRKLRASVPVSGSSKDIVDEL